MKCRMSGISPHTYNLVTENSKKLGPKNQLWKENARFAKRIFSKFGKL